MRPRGLTDAACGRLGRLQHVATRANAARRPATDAARSLDICAAGVRPHVVEDLCLRVHVHSPSPVVRVHAIGELLQTRPPLPPARAASLPLHSARRLTRDRSTGQTALWLGTPAGVGKRPAVRLSGRDAAYAVSLLPRPWPGPAGGRGVLSLGVPLRVPVPRGRSGGSLSCLEEREPEAPEQRRHPSCLL